ncbi:putative iron-dependent peroxidase [Actinacidiphila yanglinensis]|uniref:Putative iron-dependent peroxidase n=1 Tax=Actinacidiphila yanglinensis TaxID=310779 RepID=A0A1H6DVN1_9ACTN|nr:Dyp-type peroxidase [Actinacidiphila yanglinensis]SEG89432.1 putative iron-dependent peroxidase [Actinacidiphila yanglinensis]
MATEPEPQSVLSPLTTAAIFLVLTVEEGGEDTARDLLADLGGLTRAIGFGAPDGRLSCVAGIGSDAWDRLFDHPRPAGLHPFTPLQGPRHRAVSTPGDLLFHLRATRLDLCFALAGQIMGRLRGAVALQDEVQGFKYLDVRDLLGFVDGTENPVGPAAREAVLVGAEDPAHAGGSYVIVQKYLHDLDGWNALPVEAQERIIGRTKATNIERDEDDSHVALNTVTGPDGEEQDILRDNMPFGSPGRGEFGTYFIGYSRTPDVTEQMLRNMFLGTSAAPHDRILDFSTALTGTLFYAPSADFLDDLPDAPGSGTAADAAAAPAPASVPAQAPARPAPDGSLGIGNLNRSTPS